MALSAMAGVKHLPSEISSFKATNVLELKLRKLEKIDSEIFRRADTISL